MEIDRDKKGMQAFGDVFAVAIEELMFFGVSVSVCLFYANLVQVKKIANSTCKYLKSFWFVCLCAGQRVSLSLHLLIGSGS